VEKSNSIAEATDSVEYSIARLETWTKQVSSIDGEGIYWTYTLKNSKTGNVTFHFLKKSWPDAMVLLKRGDINLIIENNQGNPVYHFDPSNSDAQLTYLVLTKLLQGHKLAEAENIDKIEPMKVSGTRYIDFLIPGLIAMGIMSSCLWGISYNIIEKRSKKLLRRMVATPMRKSHFLVAVITVRTAMNLVEGILLVGFAFLVFNFRLEGSPAALFTIFISGNIAFAGISVPISSRTAKNEIGNGLINVVSMPMMVLSGIFFSYHNFPEWSIPVIKALPLTLMADGLRSVFTEGAGLAQVSGASLILAISGIICFAVGLRIFKWH
jgi:ABC-2 type transport system permease protein